MSEGLWESLSETPRADAGESMGAAAKGLTNEAVKRRGVRSLPLLAARGARGDP